MSLAISVEWLTRLHLHASTFEIHSAFISLAIFMLTVLQPVQLQSRIGLGLYYFFHIQGLIGNLAKQVISSFQKINKSRLQRKNGNENSLD